MSSGSTLAEPFLSIHSFSLSFIQGPSSVRQGNKKEERGVGDAPARSNFAFLPWLLSCEVVGGFAVRCCVRLA